MFKRVRELRIPLAAKCQLLFGMAVVLFISAALLVPWLRIEQLTQEVNEQTARKLADAAVGQHVAWQNAGMPDDPTLAGPAPAGQARADAAGPEDRPATIAWLAPLDGPARPGALGAFARYAAKALMANREEDWTARHYQRPGAGVPAYRYARLLKTEETCARCHAGAETSAPGTGHGNGTVGLVIIDMPLEPNELLFNRFVLLTAGLLASVLALVAFYFITTRVILQPVRVLQDAAERVSKGDLNVRSHIATGDEFQQLSQTFNQMLANLKTGEDQLRAINQSLDLKLEQLSESNVALYESNRLKNEFLANVSHELRTPLNSILGFAELLRDGSDGPDGADPRTARYVQNIVSSGRNLLELINDLLDLAKIEAGRMEVRSEPLSLNDLFEGLTSILKPLAEKKEIALAATVASDVPILSTDAPKLQQVLYNLLSNAIKFSPAKQSIELSAERADEEHVRIAVADHGPGIAPEQHEAIFEKFRQVDASVTREHSGTGLGLAISKDLMALLGGSIGVTSTPGQGATFWIMLPLKIEAGAQDLRRKLGAG